MWRCRGDTNGFVIRYGGDEFLIILPETDGEAVAVRQRIAEKVACLNETNELADFSVTLSIGSAHWTPDTGESVEEILHKADQRMYEDKKRLKAGDHSG